MWMQTENSSTRLFISITIKQNPGHVVSSEAVIDIVVSLTIRVEKVTDTLKQLSLHKGKGRATHPSTGVLGVYVQDNCMIAS